MRDNIQDGESKISLFVKVAVKGGE